MIEQQDDLFPDFEVGERVSIPVTPSDPLLTAAEAASRLKITVATLMRWAREGKFPRLEQHTTVRTCTYEKKVLVPMVRESVVLEKLNQMGQRPTRKAA